MKHGTPLDLAVIVFYFAGILLFGTWFGKYSKTTKDFFFGGQRFSWWLVGLSTIATVVGSYSFIKYSAVGFQYGFSSTTAYLNDWFLVPLLVIGWIPIVFWNRITSIPEYLERRFGSGVRKAGIVILLIYLTGYIGINLYTIGVAFNSMLGWNIFFSAAVICVVAAVYMHAGGQTSVIMTDLAQSLILITAGFLIFLFGLNQTGGFSSFWNSLDPAFKMPLPPLTSPPDFNMKGLFWQDAFGASMAFYFINQGVLMRFLSARSPADGKRAVFFAVFIVMPVVAFAVSNAGWIGRSMVNLGMLPADINPNEIFVRVTDRITFPGMFGFIMAALTAALMSTIDTLINAVAAISVNDIVMKVKPGREDGYYLKWAKGIAIMAAAAGLLLVPVYEGFKSIYSAHANFTAAITPPMIIVIVLGIFWKKFNGKAAMSVLTVGTLMMALSIIFPEMVSPFSQGVEPSGYIFMRAFYGFSICAAIGVTVSLITRRQEDAALTGLTVDSIHAAKKSYKSGREPNDIEKGKKFPGILEVSSSRGIHVSPAALEAMKAGIGDIIYVSDKRWWLGGLISVHAEITGIHDRDDNEIIISDELMNYGSFIPGKPVYMEKFL